jgi:dTDP-4-dehydrorhamnose reductase
VDAAETDEDTALLVNGRAPGWLAEELAGHGRLVHVSTDYVFDGEATEPYRWTRPVAPRSAYGRTKAAGERAVAAAGGDATVVRTAWVYGAHGGNFVRTMAGRALDGARSRWSTTRSARRRGRPTSPPAWWRSAPARSRCRRCCTAPTPARSAGTAWPARSTRSSAPTRPWWPDDDRGVPAPGPRPAWSVLDGSAWLAAGLPAPRPWRTALHLALQGGRPR